MMDTMTEVAFQIILFAGNGKSSAMEAIHEAKDGNFEEADKSLKEASEKELRKLINIRLNYFKMKLEEKHKLLNIILVYSQII